MDTSNLAQMAKTYASMSVHKLATQMSFGANDGSQVGENKML